MVLKKRHSRRTELVVRSSRQVAKRSSETVTSLQSTYSSNLKRKGLTATLLQMSSIAAWITFWTTFLSLATLLAVLAYARYQQQFLTPSVALVLGGAPEREKFAAQFALTHPNVAIWVSSGSNPEYAQWVFDEAKVPSDQWYLDYRAVDTVTNFTTLVDELQARNVKEVYLLTSDYHMRRASVIAQIVLGSRGINFKPVAIPTEHPPARPESTAKEIRDGVRSLLWVVTGKTGSEWRGTLNRRS